MEPHFPLQGNYEQGVMWKQNKTNSTLLYHILFQLYLWNSTKSLGSCSNMIWNNKKHSFISKPILTIIFHRSAHLMLSKLEKAWAECNFFPIFLDKIKKHPSHNTPTSIYSLTQDSGSACKVRKGENALCGEKSRRQAGWGLQSKFLCWQKCSVFQMVGEESWLHSCGKNCIAKYLPGASSLLLCAIVLPSSTPCCLVQKLHFQDKLTV